MNQNNLFLPTNVRLLVLYLQVDQWFTLNMRGNSWSISPIECDKLH